MSNYQQDRVFSACLSDPMHSTKVRDFCVRGFDLFGFVCGSSSHTSKVKYRVNYLWILSILDNFLHSADYGQISIWFFTV